MSHAIRNSVSGLARRMLGAAALVAALTLTAHADWSVVNLHPAGALAAAGSPPLDYKNLGTGSVLGFFASCGAGLLGWRIKTCLDKRADKRVYSPIAGTYTAHLFEKGSNGEETDKLDYSAPPSASATILYEQKNILRLVLTERANGNIWHGRVFMEDRTYGTIQWHYEKLNGHKPPKEHRFGFKRCIFTKGCGQDGKLRDYFYLIGDAERGYGREALERKEQASKGAPAVSSSF